MCKCSEKVAELLFFQNRCSSRPLPFAVFYRPRFRTSGARSEQTRPGDRVNAASVADRHENAEIISGVFIRIRSDSHNRLEFRRSRNAKGFYLPAIGSPFAFRDAGHGGSAIQRLSPMLAWDFQR